jgi:hypothetical protein
MNIYESVFNPESLLNFITKHQNRDMLLIAGALAA